MRHAGGVASKFMPKFALIRSKFAEDYRRP
jgi:hypothetical protein